MKTGLRYIRDENLRGEGCKEVWYSINPASEGRTVGTARGILGGIYD